MNNEINMNKALIKTDNDTKLELKLNKNKKLQHNLDNKSTIDNNFIVPRYGTTVDLKTNKITDQIDKYTLRNKNFCSTQDKYKISRISIDSRNRSKDPKNIILSYIDISNALNFMEGSNILQINMPLNHGLIVDSNITISNLNTSKPICTINGYQFEGNYQNSLGINIYMYTHYIIQL